MRFGMEYKDPGAEQYEREYRDRVMRNLKRRAEKFAMELQPKAVCVS